MNLTVEKPYWYLSDGEIHTTSLDKFGEVKYLIDTPHPKKRDSLPVEFFSHQLLELNTYDDDELLKFASEYGLAKYFCSVKDNPDFVFEDGFIGTDFNPDDPIIKAQIDIYEWRLGLSLGINDKQLNEFRDELLCLIKEIPNNYAPDIVEQAIASRDLLNGFENKDITKLNEYQRYSFFDDVEKYLQVIARVPRLKKLERASEETRALKEWARTGINRQYKDEQNFIYQWYPKIVSLDEYRYTIRDLQAIASLMFDYIQERYRFKWPEDNEDYGSNFAFYLNYLTTGKNALKVGSYGASSIELTNAIANQIIDTLNDEAEWRTCAADGCDRLFKHTQPRHEDTNKTSRKDNNSIYCCKTCADNQMQRNKRARKKQAKS